MAVSEPNADRCAYVINPRDGVVCGFPADNHMKHHAFVPPNAPEATVPWRERLEAEARMGDGDATAILEALDQKDAEIAALREHNDLTDAGVSCALEMFRRTTKMAEQQREIERFQEFLNRNGDIQAEWDNQ